MQVKQPDDSKCDVDVVVLEYNCTVCKIDEIDGEKPVTL